MALYKKNFEKKEFPKLERGAKHYEMIAAEALENSIEHLNHAYGQKLCGAEGAVEYRDGGVYTYDNNGKRYLDCLGGYGIFNVGHRHPKVIEAVKNQLDQVCLHSQDLLNPWAAYLAKQLAAIAPGDLKYSFFCNSGTEAVEGAIKLARLYTGKTEIISTKNSYHGVSMGALSATGRDVFRKPFEPLLNGFVHVPFGDIDAIENAITKNTAAVILEPIQGEGGINLPPDGYLRKVRQLTQKKGVLLILDEVQTGMGRTGRMFACEHESVVPDILCLAKALGGGVMPIGAFMSTSKIWRVLEPNPSIHNSTFGGNPLACTAASACIEVLLEEHLPARAAMMGNLFTRKLKELQDLFPQYVADVRGRGLLIGLEFQTKEVREQVQVELFHRGVLVAATMNANRTVRIEPPLIITEAQVLLMIETLSGILQELKDAKVADITKKVKKRDRKKDKEKDRKRA
ncbi:MAG: aminotransferase class III-fold pyridoxal phosphate-dependent enzyme [Candidatus Obscuribacterales bacterium]|nr:aminotransferase class III-fold pyridoxal phosphate-dependent enzyme [Candidatus Obscuribacterales bacterium]